MSKQKYLCIQRSAGGTCEPPSPGDMEKMFAVFNAWREKYQANLVDMGGKLNEAGKVVTGDGTKDGPFAEAKEVVGGYMIIEAESMDEAIEVVRESPGVGMPGSSVEIRPIDMP